MNSDILQSLVDAAYAHEPQSAVGIPQAYETRNGALAIHYSGASVTVYTEYYEQRLRIHLAKNRRGDGSIDAREAREVARHLELAAQMADAHTKITA